LLADLIRRPGSFEVPRSRALIDRVFSLVGSNVGVPGEQNGVLVQRELSDAGKEAWVLLRKLRHTAWELLGADPDIIWGDARSERKNPEIRLEHARDIFEAGISNTSAVELGPYQHSKIPPPTSLFDGSTANVGCPLPQSSLSELLVDGYQYRRFDDRLDDTRTFNDDFYTQSIGDHANDWQNWDLCLEDCFDMPGI
jgi:hypothetical protein